MFAYSEPIDGGLWHHMWLAVPQHHFIKIRRNTIAIRSNFNRRRLLGGQFALYWWIDWKHFVRIYHKFIWSKMATGHDLNSSCSKWKYPNSINRKKIKTKFAKSSNEMRRWAGLLYCLQKTCTIYTPLVSSTVLSVVVFLLLFHYFLAKSHPIESAVQLAALLFYRAILECWLHLHLEISLLSTSHPYLWLD